MGEAVKVRIESRAMVRPAQPSAPLPLFLSSLDLFWQMISPYNERLIFYESTGHLSGAALMHQLRTSLALCLVHYYPLCGRIARGPLPPHRLFIDCNDAGVEFVEASCDLPLSGALAPGRFQMNPFFLELSQHPDHMGDSLYHSPLLSIQATLFLDGGLTLGITQSHVVADGGSLWNFMVSWGECSRGVALSLPPLHNRERLAVPEVSPEKVKWFLEKAVDEMEDSVIDRDDNLDTASPTGGGDKDGSCSNADKESTGGTLGPGSHKPNPDPLVQCIFDLSSSAVKKLKGAAGEGFTSYEVMCAHFWQRLTIARQIPGCDPVHFSVLVNCRTRVTPQLSPAYFGNVIAFPVALSTAGKICGESLRVTASRIHQTIANTQEEHLVGFMHWLENEAPSGGESKPLGIGISVASSPRFPAYQVDFGWGTPIAVRPVKASDGQLVLFGGRPGGDVEICIALPDSVLRRLLDDPDFLAKPHGSPYARE